MRSLLMMTLALAALTCVFANVFDDTSDKELVAKAGSISKCLVQKGTCFELAEEVNELVKKALPKECADCTADEKRKLGKLFNKIKADYPAEFEAYMLALDPKQVKRDFAYRFLAENQ